VLLAVSPLSDYIPDALLSPVHTNTDTDWEPRFPLFETESSLGATYDDIHSFNTAPITLAPYAGVVLYTPSQLISPIPVNTESLSPDPLAEESQVDVAGDDNDSVWSQTQYGNLDWDHSGDEFENIQVTPKLTRRGSSVSPEKLQLLTGPPPDIQGSYKSFGTMVKEERAARLQRDSKGRFVPKEAPSPELVRPAGDSIMREKFTKSEVAASKDGKGSSAMTEHSSTESHLALSSMPERTESSQAQDTHGDSVTQEKPRNKRSRTEFSQFENMQLSSKRNSRDKIASTKETPVPPPKPIFSHSNPSASSRKRRPSSIAEQTPLKSDAGQNIESCSPSQKAGSQRRDSYGRFMKTNIPQAVTPVSLSNKPKHIHLLNPDKTSPMTQHENNKFIPKETPVPPPPIRPYLTSNALNISSTSSSQDNVETTSEIVLDSALPRPGSKPKRAPAKSPYFPVPSTPKKSTSQIKDLPSSQKRKAGLSCIPFPPLSAPSFGLIQEKLADDPFRLLIAVTFLIRTHGKHAIPVFYSLMNKFPTPEALLNADKETEILPIIKHLGLQNQRANTYQQYAKIWIEDPPVRGKRYAVRGYPDINSGKDVKNGEVLGDEMDGEKRVGWEIGHMTQGPYALDSWRIFCRDKLRGLADGWNGEGTHDYSSHVDGASPFLGRLSSGAKAGENPLKHGADQVSRGQGAFQPEWMRTMPLDKELRAYLRWMWLKEGFLWDPFTGEKEVASAELLEAAMEGRLEWDEEGGIQIVEKEAGLVDDR
jgi:methyl-CpG-binding domain protein 4